MLDWPLYIPSPNRECLCKVASPGKTMKKQNLCWTGHFTPPPPTENASIKWPVQVKPLKKTESMLDWPLYTTSPNRECLYKAASPGKHLKKQNLCWTGHFIPPPTENASIKWPVEVKPLKKTESMLDWPLYTTSPNRECLYKVASPCKTPEKTESMLDWPLYTPSHNRECLYKVASPGKTPEKTESMLDWPLYTPSPNRECLYKVASPGKTTEKTESMLDWPLYTPSPNRECLYKVASPGKTHEKTESMLDWPLYTPSPPTENASIKWPVQVKPWKNRIYVGLATLYPLPQQRMPL